MGSDFQSLQNQLQNSLSKHEFPIHLLATLDGEAIGTAALKFQEAEELFPDKQYWLGSVYVDEQHRGGQIASALSRKIIELARARELPQLYLQTADLSGGLYAKLGWEPLQEFNYKGEQTLLMINSLS